MVIPTPQMITRPRPPLGAILSALTQAGAQARRQDFLNARALGQGIQGLGAGIGQGIGIADQRQRDDLERRRQDFLAEIDATTRFNRAQQLQQQQNEAVAARQMEQLKASNEAAMARQQQGDQARTARDLFERFTKIPGEVMGGINQFRAQSARNEAQEALQADRAVGREIQREGLEEKKADRMRKEKAAARKDALAEKRLKSIEKRAADAIAFKQKAKTADQVDRANKRISDEFDRMRGRILQIDRQLENTFDSDAIDRLNNERIAIQEKMDELAPAYNDALKSLTQRRAEADRAAAQTPQPTETGMAAPTGKMKFVGGVGRMRTQATPQVAGELVTAIARIMQANPDMSDADVMDVTRKHLGRMPGFQGLSGKELEQAAGDFWTLGVYQKIRKSLGKR